MRNSSPSSSKINVCTIYRAWRGLKLALQDPKVYIFVLYDFFAFVGLGFIQFFPTSVMVIYFWLVFLTFFAIYSLAATMGFSTTITLLLASYVTQL